MDDMKVLVTGASGLIGSALIPFLKGKGRQVRALARSTVPGQKDSWNPSYGWIDPASFQNVDAVIHLSGEPIANGLWTRSKKRSIRDSRVTGTALLSSCLSRLDRKPKLLLCASAVGFYGDRGEETLDEQKSAGAGFLAETCQAWEAATGEATRAGVRVVRMRTGLVLSDQGGLLQGLRRVFNLGLGGPIGNGHQYMSWISVLDVVGAIDLLLDSPLVGAVNLVAPTAVSNLEFSRKLARALQRPCFLRAPAFALKVLLGQFADELLLSSQKAVPAHLLDKGYEFKHPTIDSAFEAFLCTH